MSVVNESGFVGRYLILIFKVDVRRINNDLDEFGNLSDYFTKCRK